MGFARDGRNDCFALGVLQLLSSCVGRGVAELATVLKAELLSSEVVPLFECNAVWVGCNGQRAQRLRCTAAFFDVPVGEVDRVSLVRGTNWQKVLASDPFCVERDWRSDHVVSLQSVTQCLGARGAVDLTEHDDVVFELCVLLDRLGCVVECVFEQHLNGVLACDPTGIIHTRHIRIETSSEGSTTLSEQRRRWECGVGCDLADVSDLDGLAVEATSCGKAYCRSRCCCTGGGCGRGWGNCLLLVGALVADLLTDQPALYLANLGALCASLHSCGTGWADDDESGHRSQGHRHGCS